MAIKKNIKAVLLDFDGTIVDLLIDWPGLKNEVKEYFMQFGIIQDYTPILHKIESSIKETIKKSKISEQVLREDIERILERYEIEGLKKSRITQETVYFLNFLLKNNTLILITTRNGTRVVKDTFLRFELPTPTGIFSRNTKPTKPDKELAQLIFDTYSLSNKDCIIVGDSEIDTNFGTNSRIKSYIKNRDFNSLEELTTILYA